MRYELNKTCASRLSTSVSVTMITSDKNGRDVKLKPTTHMDTRAAESFLRRYALALANDRHETVVLFHDRRPNTSGHFSSYGPEYDRKHIQAIADVWDGDCAEIVAPSIVVAA